MQQPNLPIVLASQSPRRRELLTNAGLQFSVMTPLPSAEPDGAMPLPSESTAQFVTRLATQKATCVAQRVPYPALVIGCDTVAQLCGEILGKPTDRADAMRMLRLLSGRRHSVWSGLCLIDTTTGSIWCDQAESQLDMKKLSEQELTAYLDSGDWQGKSGAFGYQDGHAWLRLVAGTAENVVGLPIDVLEKLLANQLTKPN